MARPRLPHLRHERKAWYFRLGDGPRIRLRSPFGSPEFLAEYHQALSSVAQAVKAKPPSHSLSWLVRRYMDSVAWSELSPATRRQRSNILARITDIAGSVPFADITRKTIMDGVDRRKDRPAAARHFIHAMRGLFAWAVDADLVEKNPTLNVKPPKHKTAGFHVWTDEEMTRFEERWPIGTRERLAFDIFAYTGLRRGDAARLGKQHIRDGVIRITTEKTGEIVVIPILDQLAASIAATKTGDLALIATEAGNPMTKESLGNLFRDACRAAGCPGSAHGIRKAAATRAANHGATIHQLNAGFGWRGTAMASHYTGTADREKLAVEAIKKLER